MARARNEGERSKTDRRAPSKEAAGLVRVTKAERPDPEMPAKAQRRRFSAEYKQRIRGEDEACKGNSSVMGALLRREGFTPETNDSCVKTLLLIICLRVVL